MLRSVYPILYKLAKTYWFIFRPHTTGTKVILQAENQILLIKNTYGKDSWTLVGGGLKRGENPEDAVRREVREEIGVVVDKIEHLGRFQTTAEYKLDTVWVFRANLDYKYLDLDRTEIKRARWFKIDNLPPTDSSITRQCLKIAGLLHQS